MKSIPDAAVVIKKNVEIQALVLAIDEFFAERFPSLAVRLRHKLSALAPEPVTVSPELTAMLLHLLAERSSGRGIDVLVYECEEGICFSVQADALSPMSEEEAKELCRLAERAGFTPTVGEEIVFIARLAASSEYLVFVRSATDVKNMLFSAFLTL